MVRRSAFPPTAAAHRLPPLAAAAAPPCVEQAGPPYPHDPPSERLLLLEYEYAYSGDELIAKRAPHFEEHLRVLLAAVRGRCGWMLMGGASRTLRVDVDGRCQQAMMGRAAGAAAAQRHGRARRARSGTQALAPLACRLACLLGAGPCCCRCRRSRPSPAFVPTRCSSLPCRTTRPGRVGQAVAVWADG